MRNFKSYILKRASPELKEIIRSKPFPNSTDWRVYKLFFCENKFPDELILEYERHWDKYWELNDEPEEGAHDG